MPFSIFLYQNARWLAGGLLLTFFSSFGQTFFISLSGGGIRSEYGLSHGDFGLLYMFATLGSAFTLPYIGRIVDYITVARTVILIVPALALACISMAFSNSIVLLALTIYALRLFGQGMMTHTSMTAMGRWYSAQRGKAVAVATMGHQLGEAIMPTIVISVFIWVGWRNTWLISAGVLMLVALPVLFGLLRVERTPRVTDPKERSVAARHWTRGEVLGDPYFWLMLAGVMCPGFIGTTIFFHQIYLVELRGWSPELFALSFTGMAIMTTIFALIAGWLVDRYSAVAQLPLFLVPLGAACLVLAAVSETWSMFVFMGLLGVSYGISSTLFGALWPEVYGTKHLGSVRSLVIAVMVFATAMGPGISGYLIDFGINYTYQVAAMGIYCLAASGIMLFVSWKIAARLQLASNPL